MIKHKVASFLGSALILASTPAFAEDPIHVDVTTFVRAETDKYFASYVADGALGQIQHERDPTQVDAQNIIRLNRDTLYSVGVFDLASPVVIDMPKSEGRFQSLLVIDQDHYVAGLEHDAGSYTFTQESVGTRYMTVMLRTFMDPKDSDDIREAHALQDAVAVTQQDAGSFLVPNWDEEALDRTRGLILALAADYRGTSDRTFGSKDEVDPIRHLVGSAAGWAGNPERAATYESVYPNGNEGQAFTLTVSDVPIDGFWSITVYNDDGFMEANADEVYSVNNVTAVPNADKSVTVNFGGCEDDRINCIPIPADWNYLVRLYQPQEQILDGSWSFPQAMPTQ